MKGARLLLPLLALLVAGCSLAGDVTPPLALASAQSVGTATRAVSSPQLSPSASAPATGSETTPEATTEAAGATSPEAAASEVPGVTLQPGGDPGPPAEAQAVMGIVRGSVVNGTGGGPVPSGLEVTLHGLDGQVETLTQTSKADAVGGFRFEGIETLPGHLYYVSAGYEGVEYQSESAHFLPQDSAPLELPLTVYETTTDASQVRVPKVHFIVQVPSEGMLRVSEVWVFSNQGDRSVILSEGQALVDVALPAGAVLLEFRSGRPEDRFTQSEIGFTFSSPVVPGASSTQMILTYDLAYSGQAEISQPMSYPVDSIVILVEMSSLKVRGRGIMDGGSTSLGGASYRQYIAGPLATGETLRLTLSESRFPVEMVLGSGVLLLAIVIGGLWWFQRRRMNVDEAYVPAPRSSAPRDSEAELREALLRGIASLDDEFEAGRIPEEEYRRRRGDLKQRLMAWIEGTDD